MFETLFLYLFFSFCLCVMIHHTAVHISHTIQVYANYEVQYIQLLLNSSTSFTIVSTRLLKQKIRTGIFENYFVKFISGYCNFFVLQDFRYCLVEICRFSFTMHISAYLIIDHNLLLLQRPCLLRLPIMIGESRFPSDISRR